MGKDHGPYRQSFSVEFAEIKGMGKERENGREGEREMQRQRERERKRDKKLPPQRNGRKEASRSRRVPSLKGTFCICIQTRTLG